MVNNIVNNIEQGWQRVTTMFKPVFNNLESMIFCYLYWLNISCHPPSLPAIANYEMLDYFWSIPWLHSQNSSIYYGCELSDYETTEKNTSEAYFSQWIFLEI